MASLGAVPAVTSSSAGRRAVTEEMRKRKRKESNRLSAQRSRTRKQLQVDELEAQLATLRARNAAIAAAANQAARWYAAVHAENELLRARTMELTARWESLARLVHYMDAASFNPFAGVNGASFNPQPPLLLDTAPMYCNYYHC